MSAPAPDYLSGLRWMWQEQGDAPPRENDYGPDALFEYRRWQAECAECGAPEGTLHTLGCELEQCPVCGEQAAFCDHCTTANGKWRKTFLTTRVPHIETPAVCPRCGLVHPEMFMVDEATWIEYVPPYLQNKHLCFSCYCEIAAWTQAAREQRATP